MKYNKILFIFILVLFLVGCGRSKPEPETPQPENPGIEDPGTEQPKEVVFETDEEYIELGIYEKHELNITIENVEDYELEYEDDTIGIIEIDNGVIEAIDFGYTVLTVKLIYGENIKTLLVEVEVLEVSPTKILAVEELELVIGQTYQIEYTLQPENASRYVEYTTPNSALFDIDSNGLVTTLQEGTGYITIKSLLNPSVRARIEVKVVKPYIEEIKTQNTLTLGYNEEYQLEWSVLPSEAEQEVIFTSSDERIASVDENGKITTDRYGECEITISSKMYPDKQSVIKVKVEGVKATTLTTETNISLNLGQTKKIEYLVSPQEAYQKVDISTSNEEGIKISKDGYITGIKNGTYEITLKTIDETNIEKKVIVEVEGSSTPIFVLESTQENIEVAWGKDFDPLAGVYAYDGEDGDLTDNIEVSGDTTYKGYRTYVIIYEVSDSNGNSSTYERIIDMKWNYDVTVIGHAGSYYGVPNSEEAILYAAQVLRYPAIEIDVKQTKDGVFVLSHDPVWGTATLENTNWEDLKDVEYTVTKTQGIVGKDLTTEQRTYTAKICTLERYLEICKEYGITAVIELKTSIGISNWTESNAPAQSKMPKLMEIVEKTDMLNQVIFLSNQELCLNWVKQHYSYIPCQYLSLSSCESEATLNIVKKYNLDISFNVRDGIKISDEWLQKYRDAGCKLATFTFEEMLNQFCSKFNTYDDYGNDYDPYTPTLLNKLRKMRNNIVHSEINDVALSQKEIKDCIDYICSRRGA